MLKPRFSNCSDNLSNVVILHSNSACRRSSVPADGDVISMIVCNSAGTTTIHGSETSHATGTGVTSASGSTTVGASGTTTKQCQEMEAVDDAVSKTITVTPKDIDQN
ncbi:unnamed protein product, partial [Adineta steineri]